MIAAGTRLLSWTLCQRCCAGDPPSQVPRSRCTSSLATISGFIIAQRSRCARPCAVSMARRSWWRSRSIGECLEPHSPLPVPYRGRAVGVIYRVPPLPRWPVQLCGPCSSSSKLDFLAGQRPPSSSPTPSTSSRNGVCSCARAHACVVSDRSLRSSCAPYALVQLVLRHAMVISVL